MECLIVGIIVGYLLGVPSGMILEDIFDFVKFKDKIRK